MNVEKNDNTAKLKIKLAETDDMIIAVMSKINIVINVRNWVIGSGASRHCCTKKNDRVIHQSWKG